jgi:hypothetical protein
MAYGNMRRARIAAAAAMTTLLISSAALADEQTLINLDFESTPTFTSAPNTSALGIDPLFVYSYSGLNTTFTRTEGVDNDGVGGSHAIFQSFDGTAASASFFYYIGLGRYVYNDPAIGGSFGTASQLKWTFDMKGVGQDPEAAPQVTARFALQTGTGDAFVALKPLAVGSDYSTQGGTLDQFFPTDADPDGGGPLPPGPGTFSSAYSFIAQFDYGNNGFGFDAGNKLSIDNFKITVIRPVYHGPATGAYENAASWSEGVVPNSTTAFPQFGPNGSVARTVTLNSAITVNRMDFAGAIDDSLTINGTGSITLQGDSPGLFDHEGNDSTQTIEVPVILAKNGRIRVNAGGGTLNLAGGVSGTGNISKDRNGRVIFKNIRANGSLDIIGGTVELKGGISSNPFATNSTSVLTGLTISATEASANLRLNDARVVVDHTGSSPYAALVTAFQNGKITVSETPTAAQTVAIVERSTLPAAANTFGGAAVDSTSVLILSTLKGDANIDRVVDFGDLVPLAQNYNTLTGATWVRGDFDYDGDVDFADLVPLAQNYNGTFSAVDAAGLGGSDFAADWALAQSLVPEPTTLLAGVAGVFALASRRRNRIKG